MRYRARLSCRARPPFQCFGVPSPVGGPIGFSVRALPPLFVFSFGVCWRVCCPRGAVGGPFVFARPSPPSPVAVLACVVPQRYRAHLPNRARPPYSCLRSVEFRRSQATVEDSDRRSKQVRSPLEITIGVVALASPSCRSVVSLQPIDRCTLRRYFHGSRKRLRPRAADAAPIRQRIT